ncbi:MAG: hypothetical protein LBF38_01600 [Deltaproteobacteria bacterium]|jgi:hypothetical protein|nr:hypothetical protein [Deltaproteobacteria bacterium]
MKNNEYLDGFYLSDVGLAQFADRADSIVGDPKLHKDYEDWKIDQGPSALSLRPFGAQGEAKREP